MAALQVDEADLVAVATGRMKVAIVLSVDNAK